MKNICNWVRKNSATILSCLAAGGVVLTGVLSAKAARKSDTAFEQKKKENPDKEFTKKEEVLIKGPSYLPAVSAAAGTILCIVGSDNIHRQNQALLISALAYVEKAYADYKTRVNKLVTEEEAEFIDHVIEEEKKDEEADLPPWDGVQTFYIDHYGKFFEKTMEEVIEAEYHLNRNFVLRGFVTFNDFLDFLDLPHVPEGDDIGWERYAGEVHYGYDWIDFDHPRTVMNDMLVRTINMPFAPHKLDEDY